MTEMTVLNGVAIEELLTIPMAVEAGSYTITVTLLDENMNELT